MIELERHIEILLLSNDCVIVPGLGGFMTHHVQARYDERDNMFLPPLRTLGFNPQLNINDSLLVQSYIEAYDLSYPEALQRIDDEVNELRQHLENEGSYELNDIGVLSLNEDGHNVFTPCEAGILTPALYGLSSFEMTRLDAIQPVAVREPETARNTVAEPTAQIIDLGTKADHAAISEEQEEETDGDDVVHIKFSWIRNAVAVAAILLAIFILSMPTGKTEMMTRAISNINNGLLFGMMSEDTNMSKIEIKKADSIKLKKAGSEKCTEKAAAAIEKDVAVVSATDSIAPAPAAVQPSADTYCIVLASYVSMRNANSFVERLNKQGYDQAEVFVRNQVTRVIYGHYASENDAYNDLRRFHRHSETAEAWVMQL